MPIRIAKVIRKVATSVGAIVGIGTGSAVGLGSTITGDVIIDALLIIGCLLIIGINGKDGLPDWLIAIMKEKAKTNKKK